jgi:hypothetical protein
MPAHNPNQGRVPALFYHSGQNNMKKKILIWCSGIFLLIIVGYVSYHQLFPKDPAPLLSEENVQQPDIDRKPELALHDPKPAFSPAGKTEKRKTTRKNPAQDNNRLMETEEQPIEYPKDIKIIREQLYDLGIETVEDIELLNEIVQTGDTDAREFWSEDWRSADDFKAEEDGFKLERNTDGTYKWTPDEVAARSYSFFEAPQSFTYDPDRNEFNWDADYYGKTITNKIKFINEETAVLMIISGQKVTTNIYHKNQPPDEEYILPEEE